MPLDTFQPSIVVLVGTAGAGGMAPPASTRIPTRLNSVQEHVSPVNMWVFAQARRSVHVPERTSGRMAPPATTLEGGGGAHAEGLVLPALEGGGLSCI